MLNQIRLQIADILNKNLLNEKLIFLDIWSFIHLSFGIGIMYLLLKIKSLKLKILYLFTLLAIYEIIEFFLYTKIPEYFITETITNWVWDLIIGLLGGSLMLGIDYLNKNSK